MNPTFRKTPLIGEPLDRVDGRLKVTGQAKYAAEFPRPNLAYGYIIQSTVARGEISTIDSSKAEAMPGVLAILTHENAPRLIDNGEEEHFTKPFVLQSAKIDHFGQRIGLVVAETFEQARDAAMQVTVNYHAAEPNVSFEKNLENTFKPEKLLIEELKPETRRGDFEKAFSESEICVDEIYVVPNQHNNPMEPHATIAEWDGDHLTLHDSSQHVNGAQKTMAGLFGLDLKNVHVISPFIGGGFGCKVPAWEHVTLAVMAAKRVGRPVKIVLSRQQMFPGVGYRPLTWQRMRIGAKRTGEITALGHEIRTPTDVAHEYIEHAGAATPMLYSAPNLLVPHLGVELNWPRGTIMRAPGNTPGLFALECALDELAYALDLDPIELRKRNEPPHDPQKNLPWSTRNLMECFRVGADKFDWSKRSKKAGAMREGRKLIGVGVASATFPALRMPSSARVRLTPDGRALVQLAATDIGTGTYTSQTQVAADTLGLAPERITVQIGDTDFPPTPGSGGSWGAASYGSGVLQACADVRRKLLALTHGDAHSPLKGLAENEIEFRAGRFVAKNDSACGESFTEILKRHSLTEGIEGHGRAKPGDEEEKFSMHTFGAQFAEVQVDADTGEVHVSRFLGVFASGRILNEKTASSQISGGIVMGIGMALSEASIVDERYGQFVNADLAGYHVAVNRDAPQIEVMFLEERDDKVNPLGVKGLGEVGLTGAAAAIANAIYHATGKRIRELPITPDKLL